MLVIAMENLQTDMFGGLIPKIAQFEVTGTFTTGMYDYDTKNVYTTLEDAQGAATGQVSENGGADLVAAEAIHNYADRLDAIAARLEGA